MSVDPNISSFDESVCFDLELIRRYEGRGPRYTSYPTALQFSDKLTEEDYLQNALASNASGVPLSLYVHIPFCHTLCYYCGCNKIVTRNQGRVSRYLENLYREIDMQAELFDSSRVVEQLHFGGGTPTYLDESQLRDLMQKLGNAFNLDDSDDRQFSIEVDPRTVDEDGIRLLTELGFNRLSLGIQDFDQLVQEAVNRKQNVAEVSALLNASRDAGFKSISFDLIYGLPKQNVASFDNTLDAVIEMRPDRLAVYNYAHLPQRFKGQRMINADDIPAPETKLEILDRTIHRLAQAGYIYIGMDHFALPEDDLVAARRDGTLQRNFQGYSTHRQCDLIGVGVSSISSIGNVFSQNSVTTMEYESRIEEGRLPVHKGVIVDDDDLIRADVIQSLMCYDELLFDDFDADHEVEFRTYFEAELKRLPPLVDDELIDVSPQGIHIKPKGRLLLRNIAMIFDRYINDSQNDNRFSKAI
ncbi:MAG: oxygen-independent coproporphyrinogen III oxidase [Gammaproteobacteria bacterium]|nr:oxygen-independent coproporphyrinogen III oxidase [Gammaproteobacteria bacterium]MDH3750618.1 oxygen-independent coproporphyrinogen III oxidase [Gammaproteobacteria bacterium]MDH3804723.1 oxygen-independent coproporphyrinogen III oxidase [Gammaproteobacteria bacterium]